MASGTGQDRTFFPEAGPREAYRDQAERAFAFVDKIIEGDAASIERAPWTDLMFQRAVIERLRRMQLLQVDAKKLAIVKEVFGGK